MRRILLFCVCSIFYVTSQAQKSDATLFKIDKKIKVPVFEYKRMFSASKKTDHAEENFDENLKLFVDYQLKLIQAKELGIDTISSLKKELKKYKSSLANNYLKDTATVNALVKEAYQRSLYKVKASHILIQTEGKDTVAALKKIHEIQEQLKEGDDFETLAAEFSEDPSAKKNKGSLGYFTAFNMVYPFENAAYSTEVGQISDIVKTRFGYHLLKVDDKVKRESKFSASHIMIAGFEENKKLKIDSIYQVLQDGGDFEELAKKFSDDKFSGRNGGVLQPFELGTLPKSFEDELVKLTKEETYSTPFKTHVGWHIVKYHKRIPLPTFDEEKGRIKSKVLADSRGTKSKEVVYKRLEKEFNVTVNEQARKAFDVEDPYNISKDSLQNPIIEIKGENILQEEFANYINSRRIGNVGEHFQRFKEEKIRAYLIDHLQEVNEDYKKTITSYEEGLIIFELMKQKIWDESLNESEKIETYFKAHPEKYKNAKDFESVKGYVQSDYQDELQNNWLSALRKEHTVKYCKSTVKKLKKSYQ